MIQELREVRFDIYCKTCASEKVKETDDPCNECLSNPSNFNSEKPVNWKEKDE